MDQKLSAQKLLRFGAKSADQIDPGVDLSGPRTDPDGGRGGPGFDGGSVGAVDRGRSRWSVVTSQSPGPKPVWAGSVFDSSCWVRRRI